MPTLETVEPAKVAGFVTPGSQRDKRHARLAKEEADLLELLKGNPEVKTDDSPEANVGEEAENKEDKIVEEENRELSSEESTFKKRYGDLRRHSQLKEKDLGEKIKQLESRLNSTDGIVAPKSDEDILEWSKQYPDIAGIVEKIADRKAEERFGSANERLQKLDEQQDALNREKSESVIRKKHPDFDKLRDDDKFYSWVDSQSKLIQNAIYENEDDPSMVISVIDLYKINSGQAVSSTKQQTKDAAKSVDTHSKATVDTDEKPRFSESQLKKNSDTWFMKNVDAIREAQRDGRFDYDVSGAR